MRHLLLLVLLAVTPTWAEDGAKPTEPVASIEPTDDEGFVLLRDSKRRFSIVIPDSWKIKEVESTESYTRFDLDFPGGQHTGRLFVELPLVPYDLRGFPDDARVDLAKDTAKTHFSIRSNQLPHIVYRKEEGDNRMMVVNAFRRDRGNTLTTTVVVRRGELDAVYEPFLRAARTTRVDRPPFPQVPKGYKTTSKRGLRYAVHSAVAIPPKFLVGATQEMRKRFESFHGKLPAAPRGSPAPIFFIHRNNNDAKPLSSEFGDKPSMFLAESTTLRFFATQTAKSQDDRTDDLYSRFGKFLVERRYGTSVPLWVKLGERTTARIGMNTGKKLPWIPSGFYNWSEGLKLDRLDAYPARGEGVTDFGKQSFFYVALFHCGGSKYRNAYRRFLEDIATRYDPQAAAQRHLEPLDYGKLQAAATKFMARGLRVREK